MRRRISKRLYNKYKKQRVIFLFIVLIAIVYFTPKYVSLSRYVYDKINPHFVLSREFCFESDKLSAQEGFEYNVTEQWSGNESFYVMVNMYTRKNDLFLLHGDINYNITCTSSSNITASLSKTSGTIVGTDNNGSNEDFFSITINPNSGVTLHDGDKVWIDVTTFTTFPYALQLSGRIIVTVGSSNGISYKIADWEDSPYMQVDVSNKDLTSSNITLSFDPTVVLLDNTSEAYINAISTTTQTIGGYTYVNGITFQLDALHGDSVKFYKMDKSQDYSYSGTGTSVVTVTYTSNST